IFDDTFWPFHNIAFAYQATRVALPKSQRWWCLLLGKRNGHCLKLFLIAPTYPKVLKNSLAVPATPRRRSLFRSSLAVAERLTETRLAVWQFSLCLSLLGCGRITEV